MEAINYAPNGQNMILSEDAQIVQGVSGNACYLPAGIGRIALAGNRNELSVSLWRQWDGVVETDAPRGVFSFKNIQVFFDHETDLLTVVINDFKAITDIKDDQKQAHWCFIFAKNNRFTIYKDSKTVYELSAGDKPVDMTDGFTLGGGKTHATFDEVRLYKTVLKQGEINGLFYLVSKGTQVKQLEKIVQSGEKLGAQDAHVGDWVLMAKTVGGWKCGVCYRWTGSMWINLEPEYNYTEHYQAALYHICEIDELMKETGHFGALFAKALVAQEAFIKKLAADQAFLRQLVVQKLRIDSDKNSNQDFEAWFDEENGLKIKNNGEEIFSVKPDGAAYFSGDINTPFFKISQGKAFAKQMYLEDGFFSGNIVSGPLELLNTEPSTEKYYIYKGESANTVYTKYPNVWIICENELSGTAVHSFYTDSNFTGKYVNINGISVPIYQNYVCLETPDGTIKISGDEVFEESFTLISKKGGKTLKLKNLPTTKPKEKGILWVAPSRALMLS